MNIKIIKVELNTQVQKKDGGTYPGHKVTYEDEGEVKSKGFHEKVLQYRGDLRKAIEHMEEGEWYNINLEKNDRGYWEWVSVSKGSETSAQNNKGRQNGNNTGIAVGHALHCASRLLAGNDFDAETLKKTAYMVYNVSKEMQSEIDTPEF